MNGLIDILVLSGVAFAVIAIGCVVWGAIMYVDGKRKKRVVLMTDYAVGNPMSEEGMTVIYCGIGSVEDVERIMSAEYVFYEIVLVCDSACCRGVFSGLLNKYSMLKVEYVCMEHVNCGCVRGVYRSKERRYKRLVVIDHAGADFAECLNCGLVVSSYDHVIPVAGGVLLNKNALALFNAALHDLAYDGVSFRCCDVCVGGVVEWSYSNGAFSTICRSFGNLLLFLPFVEMPFCRRRVFMFRRDGVVANGGFVRGVEEPFHSAGYCERYLMIPFAVASGEVKLCGSARRLLRVLFVLFWGGCLVTLIWSQTTSCMEGMQKMWSLLLVIYLSVVAVGALSVAVLSDREDVAAQLKYRSLLSLVLYPLYEFFVLWRMIWR